MLPELSEGEDKMTNNNLFVFIETNKDGSAKSVGLELLAPGKELAEAQGCEVVAVVIGNNVENAVKEASAYGAKSVVYVDGEEFAEYTTDAYANALTEIIRKYEPNTVLIGATNNGRDLAPRISCRLKTGLTADCTSLGYDPEGGNITWTRPAFGGNLMAQIICPNTRPQIGTVRPGIFKKPARNEENCPEIIKEDIHVAPEDIHAKIVEIIDEINTSDVDITAADIVVAGGRGTKGEKGFAVLKELADALGGVLGATRPAVDEGWISHAHQVGQTGKTISPKIYFACGISGAIQHTVGMNGSDIIVAINKDPDAPIFGIADYAVVGDLFEIVPMITKEILARKAN